MNQLEAGPNTDGPAQESIQWRPAAEKDSGPAEPPPQAHSIETVHKKASPEEEERLQAIERQIDGLREELQTMTDAYEHSLDIKIAAWKAPEREENLMRKFLGIFRRKEKEDPGKLSMRESSAVYHAREEAENHLRELLTKRDALEEKIIDAEVLRERRKTRASHEYLQALEDSGRFVTSEEKYQAGKGQAYWDTVIDKRMEELKRKRLS